MKTCQICGRPIRTGWKYCWRHRNFSGTIPKNTMADDASAGLTLLGIGLIIISLIIFFISIGNLWERIITGLMFFVVGIFMIYLTLIDTKNEKNKDAGNIKESKISYKNKDCKKIYQEKLFCILVIGFLLVYSFGNFPGPYIYKIITSIILSLFITWIYRKFKLRKMVDRKEDRIIPKNEDSLKKEDGSSKSRLSRMARKLNRQLGNSLTFIARARKDQLRYARDIKRSSI